MTKLSAEFDSADLQFDPRTITFSGFDTWMQKDRALTISLKAIESVDLFDFDGLIMQVCTSSYCVRARLRDGDGFPGPVRTQWFADCIKNEMNRV